MECLQLFHLLLEDPYVVHEGDDSVCRHRGRVETGRRQQRSDVERHGALGGVKDEQLGPDEPEESDLVRHLIISKGEKQRRQR